MRKRSFKDNKTFEQQLDVKSGQKELQRQKQIEQHPIMIMSVQSYQQKHSNDVLDCVLDVFKVQTLQTLTRRQLVGLLTLERFSAICE